MLADAIAAEGFKLLRQRGAVFWGFCVPPLGVLGFNLALNTWLSLHLPALPGVDLGQQVIRSLGLGGSTMLQIFVAVGASSIFGGEYRWETWRLLTPRNSRLNLLLAKLAIYALAAAMTLLLLAGAAVLESLYAALLGARLALPGAGVAVTAIPVFLASWAELLVLGAVVAFAATVSRATTAALMTGICFSILQTIGMLLVHPFEAPLRWFAALPGMDAYLLRAWASGEPVAPGVTADPAKALPAALFLLAWMLLVGGAALAHFQRQDLPRE
jgi:ABC-2 type transport system permease protein